MSGFACKTREVRTTKLPERQEPTELVGMLATHYELMNKAVTKIMTLLGGIYED